MHIILKTIKPCLFEFLSKALIFCHDMISFVKVMTIVQPSDGTIVQPTDGTFVQPTDGTFVQPTDGTIVQPTDGTFVQPTDGTIVQPIKRGEYFSQINSN